MLRLYLLQNLHDLSGEATVAEAIGSCVLSEFCGVGFHIYPILHQEQREEMGPRCPPGQKGQRPTKRVDKDSELVYTVEATAANAHDVSKIASLLTGEAEEHAKSSVRAKVKYVLGIVKKQLHFRKARYRGFEK